MAKKKPSKKTKPKSNAKSVNKPKPKKVSRPGVSKKQPVRVGRKTIQKRSKPKAKTTAKSLGVVKTRKVSTVRKRKNVKGTSIRNVNTGRTTPVSKKITTQKIKGKNTITFKSGGKPENVAKKFTSSDTKKELNYYLKKNKKKGDKFAKEPKAVAVVLTVLSVEGVKKVFSEITPPDFVVNETNLKKFIALTLENASDSFEGFYGDSIDKILNYALKFIY